jgi:hypothetical protein
MHHAVILGAIGSGLSLIGVIAATRMDLGPIWYPILVALVALPWAVGALERK